MAVPLGERGEVGQDSVVLVPAHAAASLMRDLRLRHDPSANAGMPPHITLMFPFLPPQDLNEVNVGGLQELVRRMKPFEFELSRVNEFEPGVVYLEPEPAEPFERLTRDIGARFGLLPFAGEFGDSPVVHLTLTMPPSRMTLQKVAARLEGVLPVRILAEEVWLMVGSNSSTWTTVRSIRFEGLG